MKKPKKWAVIFVAMAVLGTNLEIAARAWSRDLVCPPNLPPESKVVICAQGLSPWSLAGWTSLWMLFVYGFGGLVLGAMNENPRIGRLPMLVQCLMGAVLATAVELLSGLVLNVTFHLQVWDYSGEPAQYLQQISLRSAILFFLVSPLAFWLDDAIRYVAYKEKAPEDLISYYLRLFDLRRTPAAEARARRKRRHPPHRGARRRIAAKRRIRRARASMPTDSAA